jgi:hypothetical protein
MQTKGETLAVIFRRTLKFNNLKQQMILFNLTERRKKFELGYGDYRIYFVGAFSIENIELVNINLYEAESGKEIELKDIGLLGLKPRDFINGEKAIACFSFFVEKRTDYIIELNNFENLQPKKSMLFLQNLLFPSKIRIEDLKIAIK